MFSLYYLFINCQEKHFDKTIQKNFFSLMYNKKVFSESETYKFPKGTTEVLEEIKKNWKNVVVESEAVPMDMC